MDEIIKMVPRSGGTDSAMFGRDGGNLSDVRRAFMSGWNMCVPQVVGGHGGLEQPIP